jgi:hypothetical protein
VILLLMGCWPDIRGVDYEPFDPNATGPKVLNTDEGDGVTFTLVDATDNVDWVYVDFDGGAVEVEEDEGWELGFSRSRIPLNGGASGDGGVEAAVVEAATIDGVTEAPTEGYAVDLPDDDIDDNADPEYVLDVWFDYDATTHVLTPHDYVFVVRTTDGGFVAVEIVSYYDEAGTSGLMQIRWKEL